MHSSRIFRLFISSTFSDFILEREALQREVFPKLQAYCAEKGARFLAIDLRWGISDQAQTSHETLRICLEEVRRCQEQSPAPNFAVLLGNRYGWEPPPVRIPVPEWTRLLAAATTQDRITIRGAYEGPDRNAVPASYVLKPRKGTWGEFAPHEAAVRDALRRAVEAAALSPQNRLPYFTSATHQEIVQGALLAEGAECHVHVYQRHIVGLPPWPGADERIQDFIDTDPNASAPGAQQRLADLAQQLSERLPPDFLHHVNTNWVGGETGIDTEYLPAFCEAFLQHQKALIDAELCGRPIFGEGEARDQAALSFANERSRNFVGRRAAISKVAKYLDLSNDIFRRRPARPYVLTASGGAGKSALMSRVYLLTRDEAQTAPQEGLRPVVMARFIGGTPGTESLMQLLTDLVVDLAQAYGQPKPKVPVSTKEAAGAFAMALAWATAEQPLVLFLDALDQLDPADSVHLLQWFPVELPLHVRLVASTRTGPLADTVTSLLMGRVHLLPLMSLATGRQMLQAWLGSRREAQLGAGIAPTIGRRLNAQQTQALLSGFARCRSPLWLKLASEEAAAWPSWQGPPALPDTVEGLVTRLLRTTLTGSHHHPQVFTERALAYLAAPRNGLAEEELAHALGTDPAVRDEFKRNERTQLRWTDQKALPPILWSRLFFDLQPYLSVLKVDGAQVMRFFHREFVEVVQRALLSEPLVQEVHMRLAQVFADLAPGGAKFFRQTDASDVPQSAALRRVMEQPWHLARAGNHQALETLLTDFGFVMAKCAANRAQDLQLDVLACSGSEASWRHWQDLFRAQSHLLRRGSKDSPGHKILLQVAVEDADESAITQAAEHWLEQGHCDWVWARRKNRPAAIVRKALLSVMEAVTPIGGAIVSAEGRVLSWSHEWFPESEMRLWDGATGALTAVMVGHDDAVTGACAMTNERLLSWSHDCTLRMWDGRTGAPLAVLTGHDFGVAGAEVLSDGRVLSWSDFTILDGVWGNSAGCSNLRLWDGQTGAPLVDLVGHTGGVIGARQLSTGQILSRGRDGTVRLWDGETGTPKAMMDGLNASTLGAIELNAGRVLLWLEDGTLRVWDIKGDSPPTVMNGNNVPVLGAKLITDGRVLSWSRDGALRLWDGSTGALLRVLEGECESIQGALGLSSGYVVSWSLGNNLHLWNADTGDLLSVLSGHADAIKGAFAMADGRLLSWSSDETLRIWDGRTGVELAVLHAGVEGAIELPDGRVLTWSSDLRLWEVPDNFRSFTPEGHRDSVWGAKLLYSEQFLSWSKDGTLRMWDKQTGAQLAVLDGHSGPVNGAEVLFDGTVISWSADGTLRLWDQHTGEQRAVLDGKPSWTNEAQEPASGQSVFSQQKEQQWALLGLNGPPLEIGIGINGVKVLKDGRLLSWSEDGRLQLWDLKTDRPLAVLRGHTRAVRGVEVLADGRILSWSDDGTLRLWDGTTGALLLVLEGHTHSVTGALTLTDGNILSWSKDNTLRLWNNVTGMPLAEMDGFADLGDHTEPFCSATILGDRRVLFWTEDGALRMWDSQNGLMLRDLDVHLGPVISAETLGDGSVMLRFYDSLCIWDKCGDKPRVFPQPWIEATAYPTEWENDTFVGGATRFGGVWFQSQFMDDYCAITNRSKGWQARWIGEKGSGDVIGRTEDSYTFIDGRQVNFLKLMHGSQPMPADSLS